MNNSTKLFGYNRTITEYPEADLSPIIVVLGAIVGTFIIIANLVLIGGCILNQERFYSTFKRQVLSLAISDLLLGLSGIPRLFTTDNDFVTPYSLCVVHFYTFFAMRNGTLYNILAICMQRVFTLRYIGRNEGNMDNITRDIVVLVSAWAVSLSSTGVPFLLWSRGDRYAKICIFPVLFGYNTQLGVRVVLASFLVPLCITDILYIYACLRLHSMQSQTVTPSPPDHQRSDSTHRSVSTINTEYEAPAANSALTIIHQTSLVRQQQILRTIGIILLLLNLFTVSWIVTKVTVKQRTVNALMSIICLLNSAANPVVYLTRIKSLRDDLRSLIMCRWHDS